LTWAVAESSRSMSLISALEQADALDGAADWSEQHEQQMRVGVVHAAAAGLFGASLLARRPAAGRLLRLAGLAAAGLGGLLGGHLSFRLAAGANHAEPVPHLVEPGWHDLMPRSARRRPRRSPCSGPGSGTASSRSACRTRADGDLEHRLSRYWRVAPGST
jgi:hypothetical protein